MANNQWARDIRPIIVPVGPSIAYVPLTRGLFSLIDIEDVSDLYYRKAVELSGDFARRSWGPSKDQPKGDVQ